MKAGILISGPRLEIRNSTLSFKALHLEYQPPPFSLARTRAILTPKPSNFARRREASKIIGGTLRTTRIMQTLLQASLTPMHLFGLLLLFVGIQWYAWILYVVIMVVSREAVRT